MKIKSRVNGLIIEATNATAEILKLGNGAYARAISDSAVEADEPVAKKAPAKRAPAKKAPTKAEVEKLKEEAKAAGIDLDDNQIEGANENDDEDSVEIL